MQHEYSMHLMVKNKSDLWFYIHEVILEDIEKMDVLLHSKESGGLEVWGGSATNFYPLLWNVHFLICT